MTELLADSTLMKGDMDGQIQVIDTQGNADINAADLPEKLWILPIKNTVLFPGVVLPITVTRKKAVKLVKQAHEDKQVIGVIAQKSHDIKELSVKDLYTCGTIASITKVVTLPDGNVTIVIQGKNRFLVNKFLDEKPYITANVELQTDTAESTKDSKTNALLKPLKDEAVKILKFDPHFPQEAQAVLNTIQEVPFLTHFLSSNLSLKVKDKQKILELHSVADRGALLLKYMSKEIQKLQIKNKIQRKVHTDLDKQQRDYILRQQIKALQDELGYEGSDQEVVHLRKQGKEKKWSKVVADRFTKELDKLQRLNPQSAEYPVAINYVEFMLELPWQKCTGDFFDLKRAERILDSDHFGLTKVKNRILEYLAVLKLKKNMKGPILCLYGPPGVGKTSLGKSIAKALKRHYVRMSLGGVHDEAEIRGHRKTYVGAMPGKILQNLKKTKSSNPVFILDEIDKVRSDFSGDPSSALLEVLDPEQNNAFVDNYLEVEYDLSNVLFIATANSLDTIHTALRDRMEVIEINSYTLEEKGQIAKRHLVPKQLEQHGLAGRNIKFTKGTILKIIEGYTSESGVRDLERKIGAVIRHMAKSIVMEEAIPHKITEEYMVKILGTEIFDKEPYQENNVAGIAMGLAWTRVGGDVLFVESSISKGKGKLTLSGQLGEVMKESAETALSYLKSKASSLGINHHLFQQYDLHIHVPAGATPKDGPSAGITVLTALASVFTQRKVKSKLAMTGEITLRGKVLPVGGIKEKILAAKRHGVKEIILCKRNKRDIDDIEDVYIHGLQFHFVDIVDDVLEIALLKEKVRNPQALDLINNSKK